MVSKTFWVTPNSLEGRVRSDLKCAKRTGTKFNDVQTKTKA